MIKVQHPDNSKNIEQEKLLALLDEKHHQFFCLTMSHGNATYRYYQEIEPTIKDYEEWLTGLSNTVKLDMQVLGFENCKKMFSLRRYASEKKDLGMADYIKNLMGKDDYDTYMSFVYENKFSDRISSTIDDQ